ncbi:heavy metal response regulator transcription factor [Thorsellia kenyensis]|uniref:Heavy metal response regulator transcription factor n=1 Tax=Thorsellia kenyensis TaxID=1549888 RepID=A0ABV6CC55_9GAMM
MKVLIIEDEIKIGLYIKQGLEESGFSVDIAKEGKQGLELALTGNYDLAIIDIMLPGMNGWDITKRLRKTDLFMPILILTARDSLEDKVKSFNLKADDYLAKPFAFAELLARVNSLLRRSQLTFNQPNEELFLQISDLTIDKLKRTVTRGGKIIHLTPKEYNLLLLLIENSSQILTRSVIASRIWDINFDSDTNIIDVAIKRLRQKIDSESEIKLIHTKRGMGYYFEAPS